MARNARHKVEENFAIDKVCENYLALYQELLGGLGMETTTT